MGAAKSGGQEVRVGEMFVECAEKTGFPGFGFSGRTPTAPCGGEGGSRRKRCNSADQRKAAGRILAEHPGAKMEIPDEAVLPVPGVMNRRRRSFVLVGRATRNATDVSST